MEEILFKGKDVVGNWYAGNLAVVKQDMHNGAGTIKAGSYISNACGAPFAYQVRPETVCQFIGRKDKKKKKVFDTDICNVIFKDGTCARMEVVWDDFGFRYMLKPINGIPHSFFGDVEFEVIGNIHDNPELLEA